MVPLLIAGPAVEPVTHRDRHRRRLRPGGRRRAAAARSERAHARRALVREPRRRARRPDAAGRRRCPRRALSEDAAVSTSAKPIPIGARGRRFVLELPLESPDGFRGVVRAYGAGPQLWGAIDHLLVDDRVRAARAEQAVTHRVTL